MVFEVIKSNGRNIVVLSGEIDMDSSRIARKAILASIEGRHDTLVDMSAVTYIDSSGIATLVEGFQLAKEKVLEFALVGVSPFVMSVLELTRLDKVFKIYNGVDDLC